MIKKIAKQIYFSTNFFRKLGSH